MKNDRTTAVRRFHVCNVDIPKSTSKWDLNLVAVDLLSYF